MPEKWILRQYQSLPLNAKHSMTLARIREWYEYWNGDVYISFSGGKDSTVLAHIVHEYYPEVPLVFVNTGLEYPEIQAFARKMGAVFLRPKMQFSEVISTYGYPIGGKDIAKTINEARNGSGIRRLQLMDQYMIPGTDRKSPYNKPKWLALCQQATFRVSDKCCDVMKKAPIHAYERKTKFVPYIGTLTDESFIRENAWVKNGCNAYNKKKCASSQPLSFWKEQDILRYIKENGIEIASVYGDIVGTDPDGMEYITMFPEFECNLKCTGCYRTGCMFCGFGAHLDKGETRFQRLAKTHPKQYEYCMRGGQWVDNPEYDPTAPKMDGDWKNWNPKKIWVPSKEGLGMKKVFDDLNQIYGKGFIKYD